MPRLSIAIPTRQRRALLEETLRSVLPDAEAHGCEVVVSDNASEDGTRALLEDLAARHAAVRPGFQARNVGLDRNMRDVVARCAGEHVWMLGDDDVATPGAIPRILARLASDPDLLVLQARLTTAALAPVGVILPPDLAGRTIEDPVAAFERSWDKMPFGTMVVRRAHLAPERWEPYLETSHAYTGSVWSALAEAAARGRPIRVAFGDEPDVLLRGAEKSWRAESARVYLEQIPRWFRILPPLYAAPALRAARAHDRRVSRASFLVRQRAHGQIDGAFVSAATREWGAVPRLRAMAIASLPVPVARRIDGWRTAFHAARRSFLDRVRGPGK